MLVELPGWVIDDTASIRREVAEWRGLSPAERWRLAVICSRDSAWAIRASGNPGRILDHVDAVPRSTADALARLRGLAGWAGDDR